MADDVTLNEKEERELDELVESFRARMRNALIRAKLQGALEATEEAISKIGKAIA